jgi:hypothetical protein
MQPRIYTYKVTFEEIPHWYWGVHKEKSYNDGYTGSPVTHRWMWDFYTPKIQILETFPFSEEGWKEAQLVEKRLITPDLNNPLCLNENCGGFLSLSLCSEAGKKGAEILHLVKDEWGRSAHIMRIHGEKDELGRSMHGVKVAKRLMELGVGVTARTPEQMTEHGKKGMAAMRAVLSPEQMKENSRKGAGILNSSLTLEQKREYGRKGGRKGGKKGSANTNSQRWRSTVDGFISNAGGVASHNKANGWDPGARVRIE